MASARPTSSDLNSFSVNNTAGPAAEADGELLPVFGAAAIDYYRAGLSVIPTGGESGKKPCERGFMRYARQRPRPKTVERWIKARPSANIGIMTGPVSNLTVVDVDDATLLDTAIAKFGNTPVIDRSPSGGSHLYYRHNGEKTLNRLDGAAIDVRGAGGTPLVIAPPSIRPDDFKRYEFLSGGIADLERLPRVKPGSLPLVNPSNPTLAIAQSSRDAAGKVLEGHRITTLFAELRSIANNCKTIDELSFWANDINQEMMVTPLTEAEVQRQVKGVWKLREEGRCIAPGTQVTIFSSPEIDLGITNPYAFALLGYLRRAHLGLRDTFPVSPKGLAKILRWDPRTIAQCRDDLISSGAITLTEKHKPKKAARFRFSYGA